MTSRVRLGIFVGAVCGALWACGKTTGKGPDATSDSNSPIGTSAASNGSGASSGGSSATSTDGAVPAVGGMGARGGTGGASITGTGGDSGRAAWEFMGWRLNEAESCLENDQALFVTGNAECGQAPSLQRDAEGQCWWFERSCDYEGLSPDDCGVAGDSPPPCGEGGAAGAPGGVSCEELGCTPTESAGLCPDVPGRVWICEQGPFDSEALMEAGCIDLATQVPRYCCPESFYPECP